MHFMTSTMSRTSYGDKKYKQLHIICENIKGKLIVSEANLHSTVFLDTITKISDNLKWF